MIRATIFIPTLRAEKNGGRDQALNIHQKMLFFPIAEGEHFYVSIPLTEKMKGVIIVKAQMLP